MAHIKVFSIKKAQVMNSNNVACSKTIVPSSKIKILLAEDDELLRGSVQEFLLLEGYQVYVAKDGKEAVQIAKENLIDLTLMDIEMPIMNGYEALHQFKATLSPMPVIAITGRTSHEDRNLCIEAGFTDVLSKPYDLDQLTAMIKNNL